MGYFIDNLTATPYKLIHIIVTMTKTISAIRSLDSHAAESVIYFSIQALDDNNCAKNLPSPTANLRAACMTSCAGFTTSSSMLIFFARQTRRTTTLKTRSFPR